MRRLRLGDLNVKGFRDLRRGLKVPYRLNLAWSRFIC
jgi:hypothetical protein